MTALAPDVIPECAFHPDLFHRDDGDRSGGWWLPAYAICDRCPIRRRCIETELARPQRPVDGSVWGGWVFGTHGAARPHPDDLDLHARHYPRNPTTEETR